MDGFTGRGGVQEVQHLPMLSYHKANSAIFSYHWVNFKVLTVFVVKYCFLVRARGFICTIGSEKRRDFITQTSEGCGTQRPS